MALEVGQRVGDYEVLALLGAGGMGRVYKVRNIISNREEAMKVLLPDYASEPELATRFMTEIRTLGGLEHPNIAQLRTAFQFQNQLVMIMEYVEGTTLETLAGQTRIPQNRVLDFSTQVLAALSFAHSRGVTHRDIKPANIMITSHGLVKLMDFGIAKSANDLQLTRPGTTMGSVYYMSPEQVRGGTVDARSDIYSFGVTLYEMLTGRKPFQADTSYSVLNAQLNEAPMPPSQVNPALSPELNNIVLRAMVKVPDGRFQTAEEFRNAIKSLSQPQETAPAVAAAVQQGFAPVPGVVSGAQQAGDNVRTYGPITNDAATAPATGKGHRGLWIGLGAVAAILALVAAATLLPPLFKTHAGQKAPAAATDSQPSATVPDAQPTTPAVDPSQQPTTPSTTPQTTSATTPVVSQPSAATTPASKPAGGKPARTAVSSTPSQTAGAAVQSAPAGPSPQEIRMAHDRLMELDAKASAAQAGVQQIRSQQQAQGFDIRGDVLTSMNKMNNYLGEANRALGQNDVQAANEYMDRADTELASLEKFLGR